MSCFSLKPHIEHQPDSHENTDQGTASETDERKGKPCIGKDACGNRDVGKCLERNQCCHAHTDKAAG